MTYFRLDLKNCSHINTVCVNKFYERLLMNVDKLKGLEQLDEFSDSLYQAAIAKIPIIEVYKKKVEQECNYFMLPKYLDLVIHKLIHKLND